jgi:WD40 repeat protein
VAFAPDGTALLTHNLKDSSCEVWDWPGGKKRFSWKSDADRFAPGFSSDGAFVFTDLTSVERRDAKTGEKLPPVWKEPHPDRVFPLYILRAPPRAGLLYQRPQEALVFEAGTGQPVSRFRVGSGWGLPNNKYQHVSLSPIGGQYAWGAQDADEVYLFESATCNVRRVLKGHRDYPLVLGFTPDGSRLLTAGGDHTVLVWDMRLQNVPLPDALKKETDAAKLWEMLATGKADVAYLAMARLAREPETAIKLVKMKLKPIAKPGNETEQTNLADARAIELLEALDLEDARTLLKELASGRADAFRTQEAKRALERNRAVTR